MNMNRNKYHAPLSIHTLRELGFDGYKDGAGEYGYMYLKYPESPQTLKAMILDEGVCGGYPDWYQTGTIYLYDQDEWSSKSGSYTEVYFLRDLYDFVKRNFKDEFVKALDARIKAKHMDELLAHKPRKVITLCGSTRFKDDFIEQMKRLTLEGNIVITVGLFGHSGDGEAMEESTKIMLDEMHKDKISMSDAIFVINKGGYIGSSTKSEIEFARMNHKEILYMENADSNETNQ